MPKALHLRIKGRGKITGYVGIFVKVKLYMTIPCSSPEMYWLTLSRCIFPTSNTS